MEEARKQYAILHAEWMEVHIEAMDARRLCFAMARAGQGPSIDEIERAKLMDARDEELRNAMDEFVGRYFGD